MKNKDKNKDTSRIFLGIGANLTPDGFSGPREGCLAAIESLAEDGIRVVALSPWYKTAPVPVSSQPWYQNAVVEIDTDMAPETLLAVLHDREARFGRVRMTRNEARVLDIDILDFRGEVRDGNLVLPHPRLHQRAFVLYPLADLAPGWRHPVTGEEIAGLIDNLDPEQVAVLA
ncbi:2-amino-4-hydroxy-6-hydroxymethyldihydropteridine diphosphokinase [Alphaproteobacteria bacterium LSUCC0684]